MRTSTTHYLRISTALLLVVTSAAAPAGTTERVDPAVGTYHSDDYISTWYTPDDLMPVDSSPVVNSETGQSVPRYRIEWPRDNQILSGLGVVRGWALLPEDARAELQFDNDGPFQIGVQGSRIDVTTATGIDPNVRLGFGRTVSSGVFPGVGVGEHRVRLYVNGELVDQGFFRTVTLIDEQGEKIEFYRHHDASFWAEMDVPFPGSYVEFAWIEAEQQFGVFIQAVGGSFTDICCDLPPHFTPDARVAAPPELIENPETGQQVPRYRIEWPRGTVGLFESANHLVGLGVLRGWLISEDPSARFEFQMDDQPRIPIIASDSRRDVVNAAGIDDETPVGFGLIVNSGALPGATRGVHRLRLYVDDELIDQTEFTALLYLGENGDETEFLRDRAYESTVFPVPGFPFPRSTVTVRWSTAEQQFIIVAQTVEF